MALTAHSTIGDWMNDPTGGPLIRGLFEQTGADPELLTPVLGLPLQQLVAMSQGQLPQSVVDDLVERRKAAFADLLHNHLAHRRLAESVPADVLRLTPGEVRSRMSSGTAVVT